MLTSNICDGAYLAVEAYSFIIKWTQSQIFSKILLQMNNWTKPLLVWMVFTKFGWFWVVLGGFGWLWVVLAGFDWLWMVLAGFQWFRLVACFIANANNRSLGDTTSNIFLNLFYCFHLYGCTDFY